MDPHYHNLSPNNSLLSHIFESLVGQDERQKLTPDLAESWRAVDATTWEFELRKNGRLVDTLESQQRFYRVQQSSMTEAAIDSRIARDVFIALREPLGDDAWAVRVQVKPLIRFLWLGTLLMALGGVLAVTDRRYRLPVRAAAPAAHPAKPAEAS